MTETLCWTCANACGGCQWSAYLDPVPGWDAEPTKTQRKPVKGNGGKNVTVYPEVASYRIRGCPLYLRDCLNSLDAKSRVSRVA